MKKTLSTLLVGVMSLGLVTTVSAANDFPEELFDALEETVELAVESDQYMSDAEKEFVLDAFDFFAEGKSIFSADAENLFNNFLVVEGIELTTEESQLLGELFDIYRKEKSTLQRAVWAGYWSEMVYSSQEETDAMKPLVSVLSSHYLEFDISEQPRDTEKLMDEVEAEALALTTKYAYLEENSALETLGMKIFLGSASSGIFMSDFEELLIPGNTDWEDSSDWDEEAVDSVEEAMENDSDFWRDNSYQYEDEDENFDWDGGIEREIHPDYSYETSGVNSFDRVSDENDQPITRRASVTSSTGNRNYRGTRANQERMVYPKTNDRDYIVQ